MSETFTHRPVLLNECIQALNIRPEGVYLDGTLGRAGHSREIARRLGLKESTVATRVLRGRTMLAAALEKEGDVHG